MPTLNVSPSLHPTIHVPLRIAPASFVIIIHDDPFFSDPFCSNECRKMLKTARDILGYVYLIALITVGALVLRTDCSDAKNINTCEQNSKLFGFASLIAGIGPIAILLSLKYACLNRPYNSIGHND